MKYHRLNHDQFNEVHEEFAVFLATQGLDRLRWNELKNANSPKIPQLLDIFSDVVWDKIISECTFLEFSTPDQLFLFKTLSSRATVIIVKRRNISIDLTTVEGFQWVLEHSDTPKVEFFKGVKEYEPNRNEFLYSYLKKGALPSDGLRYNALESYFSNSTK